MLKDAQFVARLLSIPLQRVYAMARAGIFPAGVIVRFGNRQIRFDEDRLTRWLQAGGTLSTENGDENTPSRGEVA